MVNNSVVLPVTIVRDLGVWTDSQLSMREHVCDCVPCTDMFSTVYALFITTRPRCLCATRLGLWTLASGLLQRRSSNGNTGTTAESPTCSSETRSCSTWITTSGVALASCRIDYNLSPCAQSPHWSVARLHHQSAHTVDNIPTRSSLRASRNADLFLPRTEWRIGDHAFSVGAPRAWNQLSTELKLIRSYTAPKACVTIVARLKL